MRVANLGTAVALAALLSSETGTRAADTMLLGGVGSLNQSYSDAAPVITLKSDSAALADTIEVYAPIARGVARAGAYAGARVAYGASRVAVGTARFAVGYRPWIGYGFRPWYGYGFRPWYGYGFRPWYGYYRPFYGWFRPWYAPGVNLSFAIGGYPSYVGYYAGYPGTYYSSAAYGSPVVGYPAPSGDPCDCRSAVPRVVESAPPPRPTDGLRYDGGPIRPVPQPGQLPKGVTPPIPTTPPPPMVDAIAHRPGKKLEYLAYGEAPGKTPTTARNPLFVKNN